MADAWLRVATTTIADYIREEEVNVLRNRKLPAMLKERGRITFNHSGTEMDWKVRWKRAPITGYADGDTLSFARKDRHKPATLGWRGYSATDSVTKFEQLQNRGKEAIINIFSTTAKMLMEDMEEHFAEEFYVDGNAAGNSKKLHGLESFLGNGGAAAAGYIATPSDTYAGLSTSLGNYGGSWATNGSSQVTWPVGTGDAHYDFWSPLIVNYTSTAWSATTKTWPNTCVEALRFGITHAAKNKSKRGQVDMYLLDPQLYFQFKQAHESKQQINVNRGQAAGLVALGFTDVMNFDGVDVTSEYGVPANVAYGIALGAMELCSMQDRLFVPDGPDMEISTKSYRFSIDMMGNLKCNPRNFVKLIGL